MLEKTIRNAFFSKTGLDKGVEWGGQDQKTPVLPQFKWLKRFIDSTVATRFVSSKMMDSGLWWVQMKLDFDHPKVWIIIQEYCYVCNNRVWPSPNPTRFTPWSSSPENGGPDTNLLWRIECFDAKFSADDMYGELNSFILKSLIKP